MGRGRASLADARARRTGVSAPPVGRLDPARRVARRSRRLVRRARTRRDVRREDAHSPRAEAARDGRRRRRARNRGAPGRVVVSGALAWTLVGLGLAVIVVRRRSIAVALVTGQALVLVGVALNDATTRNDVLAAGALALRAVTLAALFF